MNVKAKETTSPPNSGKARGREQSLWRNRCLPSPPMPVLHLLVSNTFQILQQNLFSLEGKKNSRCKLVIHLLIRSISKQIQAKKSLICIELQLIYNEKIGLCDSVIGDEKKQGKYQICLNYNIFKTFKPCPKEKSRLKKTLSVNNSNHFNIYFNIPSNDITSPKSVSK